MFDLHSTGETEALNLTNCFNQIIHFQVDNFMLREFYLIKINDGKHSSWMGSTKSARGRIWSAGRGLPAPGLESS